ncbi:MAG: VPLPA-CTERM sorting domain-containing protein, partial [Marinicaulis sp.]|nr:VPLPA-CTERM sorting domain-containing protein [Marinicaulis sp.]
ALLNWAIVTESGLLIGTDSFAFVHDMISAGINGVVAFGFGFADDGGDQFYIESIETPIPAALPLLLSGIAGLGFASRKQKSV